MTTLKPYPAYKDSDLDWLGEIPAHWKSMRNTRFLRERDSRSRTGSEDLLSVSQYTGVTRRADKFRDDGLISRAASLEGYKLVSSGDLVINIMLAWNGSLGISHFDGLVSPAYGVYKVHESVDGRYLHYLFKTPSYLGIIKRESTGVVESRLRLYTDSLFRIHSPLPPLDEQRAIANFLDGMDARITRFLAARRKMIALLEEQKQAVINQAVTRGLDPDVPLKDSGVDWLGEIPAHWEVKRLRGIARVERGRFNFRPRNDPSLYGGDMPFIQTGSIAQANNVITSFSQTLSNAGVAVSRIFSKGTLVMAIAANIGDVAFLGFDACLPDSIIGFFPLPEVSVEYLRHALGAARLELQSLAPINTQGNLSIARISAIPLALPAIQEQRAISEHIDRETSRMDTLVSRYKHELDLMQEYRTRLISDVVTGKWDVRGVELLAVEAIIDVEIEAAMENGNMEKELIYDT